MRYLITIFLLSITGCVTSNIQQCSLITPGQIHVLRFTGPSGPIVSSAIQIELHKKNLLASNKERAGFLLTGHAEFSGWIDATMFELKDKNGILYFRGNATSGGFLLPATIGTEIAKRIIKKFPKNLDKRLKSE